MDRIGGQQRLPTIVRSFLTVVAKAHRIRYRGGRVLASRLADISVMCDIMLKKSCCRFWLSAVKANHSATGSRNSVKTEGIQTDGQVSMAIRAA